MNTTYVPGFVPSAADRYYNEIIGKMQARIDELSASSNMLSLAGAPEPQAAWYEDSTGCVLIGPDVAAVESSARQNGHQVHYLYGEAIEAKAQGEADADTRPRYSTKRMRDETSKAAERERLRFEGDMDKWMKIIGAGITGYQPEAYALMDAACAELVKLRNEVNTLRAHYENWRPISMPPPAGLSPHALLEFWLVERDDEEASWSTGTWEDRPETAQMWCQIVMPLGPHSEQIAALAKVQEDSNNG